MRKILTKVKKRLEVSPSPSATAVIFSFATVVSGKSTVSSIYNGDYFPSIAYAFLSLASMGVTFLAGRDAVSRNRQYEKLVGSLSKGFDFRLIDRTLASRCQRDAALVAAKDTGNLKKVRDYYREKGYRFYHILPDWVFKNPLYFFTRDFWQTSFFVKGNNNLKP